MTPLEIVLLGINGAALLLWLTLALSSKPWKGKHITVPEATVRLLYGLALRLNALSEGLDSGILAYREMRREPVHTRAEMEREIRESAKVQAIDHQEAL